MSNTSSGSSNNTRHLPHKQQQQHRLLHLWCEFFSLQLTLSHTCTRADTYHILADGWERLGVMDEIKDRQALTQKKGQPSCLSKKLDRIAVIGANCECSCQLPLTAQYYNPATIQHNSTATVQQYSYQYNNSSPVPPPYPATAAASNTTVNTWTNVACKLYYYQHMDYHYY